MKLYYTKGASSLTPNIVACEAGIDLELVKVDLSTHKTEDGRDYYEINPKGYVPALELDNGEILTECETISQYLAEMKPDKHLIPPIGKFARYRVLEWLSFITSELHKTFGPLFSKNLPEEAKTMLMERLTKRLAYLDTQLADKQFLVGEHFSVADAYCFAVARWSSMIKMDLTPYPHLRDYLEKMGEMPVVQKAMALES